MKNTEKADLVLKGLFEEFKNGTISKTIAKIPLIKDPNDDRQCWKWTLRNRILMIRQGSQDARSFMEWRRLHRTIKKGSKAIYILAPIMVKIKKEDLEENETDEMRLIGFRCQPEFDVKSTEGDKIYDIPEYKPAKIPPLTNVAKEWNIKIIYQRDITGSSLGFTNAKEKAENEISLSTENPKVFFHELSHQADRKQLGENLKGGQDPIQEAVAELSASVLCELHNIDAQKSNTWNYLRNLTKSKSDQDTEKLALKVLTRVGKVLDLILTTAQKLDKPLEKPIEVK